MAFREDRLRRLRDEIGEVEPRQAALLADKGALLLDVREPEEVAQGSPKGAARLARAFLEFEIERVAPSVDTTILVICASGGRSLFVADGLKRLGYRDVVSVRGGYRAWRDDGLAIENPRLLNAQERERYSRHLLIPEVGDAGQLRLLSSRVALIGAGGLGSPIAFYLAAAGVGTIGLFDDDRIERSNLQRQILHTDGRVGETKLSSAAETLSAFNPGIKLVLHEVRLDADKAADLLPGYDVVVDGSDNLATRYVLNDTCVRLGVPLVYGAIFQFEGQVSVFWPAGPKGGPCYRCLYPEAPPPNLTPSCAEAGVMGVLPGIVGTLMAAEVLKLLLGIGEPLLSRLVNIDALRGRFDELALAVDAGCACCGKLSRLSYGRPSQSSSIGFSAERQQSARSG